MAKWRIARQTLPVVLAAVILKLVLTRVAHFEGIIDFAEAGVIMSAGVFLLAFMLNGTMADFKESERIPGDIASTLEVLEEMLVQASVTKPQLQALPLRQTIRDMGKTVFDWFCKKVSQEQVYAQLTKVSTLIHELEKAGAGTLAARAILEVHSLRRVVTRAAVVSRTGFIAAGYAMLDLVSIVVLVMLQLARFKSTFAEVTLVPFVTLVYVYMLNLIRDIDDPFEYGKEGETAGSAEVELFPIKEYLARVDGRLQSAEAQGAEKTQPRLVQAG